MTGTHTLQVRGGNWGWQGLMLSPHSTVHLQLAPEDAPGVLVRILDGVPTVPRELGRAEILSLSINDAAGKPRLLLEAREGAVTRVDGPAPGEWELRIEGTDQRHVYLYARPGTPFPSEAELDALAGAVADPVS
jgi:hypothetical protein